MSDELEEAISSHLRGADGAGPADALIARFYDDLRRLARRKLADFGPVQTLQATALVHEAWLKLAGGRTPDFESRKEFFCAAARAMHNVLVDRARARDCRKREAGRGREALEEVEAALAAEPEDLLAIHDAVEKLDPEARRIVELRFFAGLSMAETAEMLGLPLRSVEREWAYARSRLWIALGTDSGT